MQHTSFIVSQKHLFVSRLIASSRRRKKVSLIEAVLNATQVDTVSEVLGSNVAMGEKDRMELMSRIKAGEITTEEAWDNFRRHNNL